MCPRTLTDPTHHGGLTSWYSGLPWDTGGRGKKGYHHPSSSTGLLKVLRTDT